MCILFFCAAASFGQNVQVALTKLLSVLLCVYKAGVDIYSLPLCVQEKQERAIGLLVSLGPQPGSEVTPWYMKDGQEKEKEEKDGREEKKGKEKKTLTEEEKKKRDHKLKNLLDPLNDMKKALAVKEKNIHKSKKSESRDRSVHRISGQR